MSIWKLNHDLRYLKNINVELIYITQCSGADRRDIRCKNEVDIKKRPSGYCEHCELFFWIEENTV